MNPNKDQFKEMYLLKTKDRKNLKSSERGDMSPTERKQFERQWISIRNNQEEVALNYFAIAERKNYETQIIYLVTNIFQA